MANPLLDAERRETRDEPAGPSWPAPNPDHRSPDPAAPTGATSHQRSTSNATIQPSTAPTILRTPGYPAKPIATTAVAVVVAAATVAGATVAIESLVQRFDTGGIDQAASSAPAGPSAEEVEPPTRVGEQVEDTGRSISGSVRSVPSPTGERHDDTAHDPYPFRILEAIDISTEAAERRGLAIEIKRFPIDRGRLLATLESSIEGLAGEAQAVTVRVHHDRREHSPAAYGVWNWAPDGRWELAADGDASTWHGYRWTPEFEPDKIDDPTGCRPLTGDEFDVMDSYWQRVWNTAEPKASIRRDVAGSAGISVDDLIALKDRNLAWNNC